MHLFSYIEPISLILKRSEQLEVWRAIDKQVHCCDITMGSSQRSLSYRRKLMKHLMEEHGKEYLRRKDEVKYMYKKSETTQCNVDFDRHLDIALAHIDAFEMKTGKLVSFF